MHSFHIPPPTLSWGAFIPSQSAIRGFSMKRTSPSPSPPWIPQAKRRKSTDSDSEKRSGRQQLPSRPLHRHIPIPAPVRTSTQSVFPEAEPLSVSSEHHHPRPRLDIKIELTTGVASPASSRGGETSGRPRAPSLASSYGSRHSSVCSTPPPPSPTLHSPTGGAASHPPPTGHTPSTDRPRNLGTIRIRTGPDGRRRTHISWNNQQASMHNPINFMSWFQRVETFLLQAAAEKAKESAAPNSSTASPTTSTAPVNTTTSSSASTKPSSRPSSSKPTTTTATTPSSSATSPAQKQSSSSASASAASKSHHVSPASAAKSTAHSSAKSSTQQTASSSSSKPSGGGMTIDLTEEEETAPSKTNRPNQGKASGSSSNRPSRAASPDIIMTKCDLPAPGSRHPAPLPLMPMNQPANPTMKTLPPKPGLKISRVSQGIVLSWNMGLNDSHAQITNYQLFAYQEGNAMPVASLWKKVGDVKALPLPMACTLTQFQIGNKYHFAVRAMDMHNRVGAFSDPCSIHLQ